RWCGLNHWRMRGTITVTGDETGAAPTVEPPLYVRLGLNLDAPHPAPEGASPSRQPIAANCAGLAEAVPPALLTRTVYETTSPAAVWQQLRAAPTTQGLPDGQVWDLVAWVWASN